MLSEIAQRRGEPLVSSLLGMAEVAVRQTVQEIGRQSQNHSMMTSATCSRRPSRRSSNSRTERSVEIQEVGIGLYGHSESACGEVGSCAINDHRRSGVKGEVSIGACHDFGFGGVRSWHFAALASASSHVDAATLASTAHVSTAHLPYGSCALATYVGVPLVVPGPVSTLATFAIHAHSAGLSSDQAAVLIPRPS
ncbi:hypothetical protein R1flu_021385 [Riccia fluitans]|uniref:Uncharacterized protein n=1 Tax=Riccia fluitans TaxID=41844 RepID=A0ABD1ZQC4_9MARC